MKPAPAPESVTRSSQPRKVYNTQKFSVDPPPQALAPGCRTGDLEGCSQHTLLRSAQNELLQLHRQQMAEMEVELRVAHDILNRADAPPTARITAEPLDTKTWSDPDGIYPASLVVRVQYSRGLEYLSGGAVMDLTHSLERLDRMADAHKLQWRKVRSKYPSKLKLPDEVVEQRASIEVSARLTDFTSIFVVPIHLADVYLRRDLAPWDAVVAHVVKEPGSPYKMLQEHRHPLKSVININIGSRITITELEPVMERTGFVSTITPVDACKGLRGELRFIRRDATPELRAAFTAAPKAGGVK